jgi:cell division septum initiation protein DivIVA
MLYQDNSLDSALPNHDLVTEKSLSAASQSESNIQQQLDILESKILEGVRVPLTELVVVDGGIILEHIEAIKDNLPTALAIAVEILQQRKAILQQATEQAREIVRSAQIKADHALQESTLLRQVEQEAHQIKLEAKQECEELRHAAYTEIEQWREMATLEYEAIQKDADNYANSVLSDLETKLSQMLKIVHNGRQHLEPSEHEQENSIH